MNRGWWLRFGLLMFFILVAVVHVFPTMANLNLETTKFPYKKKVNLGLDLQGGLYMVYGVDFQKVYRETLSRSVAGFSDELKKAGVTAATGEINASTAEDPSVTLTYPAASQDAVKETLKKQGYTLRTLNDKPGSMELALGRDYRGVIRDNTLNQSVQVIRNRIDEFGVTEPSIATKGDNRVVVELPGVKDIERAKALVGRTARLEFKKVNTEAQANLPALVAEARQKGIVYKEGEKYADYVAKLNEYLKGKIPADSQVLFERPATGEWQPYLLYTNVRLTGAELTDAMVSFDQNTQQPHVSFQMNPRGAVTFEALTREMAPVGGKYQYLAIVLDDVVYSAPRILGPIPGGSGQITSGGSGDQAFKEARDLAIVLRAGALPAQLDLLEQRAIGPSIGADSITHGITAGVVGCSLVFIFMIVYYKLSGVVATVSLLLNFLFTFAILIGLDATLTLPGIAALALTIGMAVDSNVIIFERIRDELTDGKSVPAAVQAGFDKAFSCIFDANITHGIVAIILLNFGTGPIRGFAVTLLIGIVTTLFCAVTVCKLAFDWYLGAKGKRATHLSI
ncbi:MAG: protein translocase subunit SecD [Proteobacteria bacterium]|nr:MAG: protein translocase subunit SecD [Pseudomonadota bacterium]